MDVKELESFTKKELQLNASGFYVHNYFIASYMIYVMNFTDMAFLEASPKNKKKIN